MKLNHLAAGHSGIIARVATSEESIYLSYLIIAFIFLVPYIKLDYNKISLNILKL